MKSGNDYRNVIKAQLILKLYWYFHDPLCPQTRRVEYKGTREMICEEIQELAAKLSSLKFLLFKAKI